MDALRRVLLRNAVRLTMMWELNGRSDRPRPPEVAQVHAGGINPLRMLLMGGGIASSHGVATHEIGFGGFLARRLSAFSVRAIDLDIVVREDLTVANAGNLLDTITPSTYDSIVISIGLQDSLAFTPSHRWIADLERLLGRLAREAPEAQLLLLAVPPASRVVFLTPGLASRVDQQAAILNAATLAGLSSRSYTFVPFPPGFWVDDHRGRPPRNYDRWATQLTPVISEVFEAIHIHAAPCVDEAERQRSLERLGILDTAPDESFDRIARLAQDLLGAPVAAIGFIDGDRQWFKSRQGFSLTESPRQTAFCNQAIRQPGALIVPDATLDARFRDHPSVTDDTHLRFCAGYPIESPNGYRIGALCIFDSIARSFSETDEAILRQLALLVQNLLGGADSGELGDPVGASSLSTRTLGPAY